jgi:hypothetical protein
MKAWIWKLILWAYVTFLFLWAMGTCFAPPPVYAYSTVTSGETAQVVMDDVRSAVNMEDSDFVEDSELITWINEGVNEIALQTQCLQGTEDIVLSGNTISYSLTTSFIRLGSVGLYDSGVEGSTERHSWVQKASPMLLPTAPKQKDRPKYFFTFDDKVYFIPTPNSDMTGTTVTVFMTTVPSGVTVASSAIETPRIFDKALRTYVRAKVYGKEGSGLEARESFLLGLFYQELFDAVEDLRPGRLMGAKDGDDDDDDE